MKALHLLILVLTFSITNYSQQDITLKDIWYSRQFSPSMIKSINSMNDGKHFTSLDANKDQTVSINKYAYANYELVSEILNSKDFKPDGKNSVHFDDYQFNSDETKILLTTETESIYRHSFKANYYIYDIASKSISPLTDFSKGKQRLAEFSPKLNYIAFVRENNLFVKDLNSDQEFAITTDGKINEIINGGTDWVYEEEFSFDKGFQWAPNGLQIAYYKFYEEDVKEYDFPLYGTLYPKHYKYKYPKAGEKNSVIAINVYSLLTRVDKGFDIGQDPDIYIPRILWAEDEITLCVQRMNRLQNKVELLVGEFKPDSPGNKGVFTQVIYTEESKTYIDVHDNTLFTEGSNKFLWTSEKDGYNHIYLIDRKGNEKQITKGKWEVTEIYGLDKKSNTIYFQAAVEHPTQREVYKINIDGTGLTKISVNSGTTSADFSNSFDYFILTHSDANTPYSFSLYSNKKSPKLIKVLEDNQKLKGTLGKFNISKKTFFTVKGANGDDLNAWMVKPSDFDSTKQYPLLMYVYGGPGINTVNDAWEWGNYFWWQHLAQQGYIVVSVDARGTGYRGRDFKHSTYLQLGKYETEDQIHAAKELGKKSFIDAKRIGIFGWSYGGYMSSLCITKGADVFKSAIAVAPVTNWRYYDNIYTERFMRTPQENGENYDINSPINHVDKLKGNYLLIHGSADDNVHFQNAMEMIDALQKANKQFDFMAYPNKNHSIYGGKTRWNLYTKMTNFLLENL